MKVKSVLTNRLIIIPMSYKIVCSVLDRQNKELEKLGIKINGEWPRKDTLDILPIVEEKLKENGETNGFDIWMIVRKEDMAIIGDAGFRGNPDQNGEIEIGYGLIEEERRKGYGYESVNGLIEWALSKNEVKSIKADCLKDNIGSIRILKKCGMREMNEDYGMIHWVLKKEVTQEE